MVTKGTVSGIISNIVTIVVDGPVFQNEICYILLDDTRLMAGIKVEGKQALFRCLKALVD